MPKKPMKSAEDKQRHKRQIRMGGTMHEEIFGRRKHDRLMHSIAAGALVVSAAILGFVLNENRQLNKAYDGVAGAGYDMEGGVGGFLSSPVRREITHYLDDVPLIGRLPGTRFVPLGFPGLFNSRIVAYPQGCPDNGVKFVVAHEDDVYALAVKDADGHYQEWTTQQVSQACTGQAEPLAEASTGVAVTTTLAPVPETVPAPTITGPNES